MTRNRVPFITCYIPATPKKEVITTYEACNFGYKSFDTLDVELSNLLKLDTLPDTHRALFHLVPWMEVTRVLKTAFKPLPHSNPYDFGEGMYFGVTTKYVQDHIDSHFRNRETGAIVCAAVIVLTLPKDLFSEYPDGYTISTDKDWKSTLNFYLTQKKKDDTVDWIEGPVLANTVQTALGGEPIKRLYNGQPQNQIAIRSAALQERLATSPLVKKRIVYFRHDI